MANNIKGSLVELSFLTKQTILFSRYLQMFFGKDVTANEGNCSPEMVVVLPSLASSSPEYKVYRPPDGKQRVYSNVIIIAGIP